MSRHFRHIKTVWPATLSWAANVLLVVLACVLPGQAQIQLQGVVRDPSGATVENALVEVRNVGGTLLASRRTDPFGAFSWAGARSGHYRLRVESPGFEASETIVYLREHADPLVLTLEVKTLHTKMTVNATRGAAEESSMSPHVTFVKELEEMRTRPAPTIGNVLEQAPGVLVQQSTHAQASPFLRGLTGYQVLNLIDGIRFNNSTFRSGPNQYLAFVEPRQAERVEALLGPTGSQYGSDSLGGTIQVFTRSPRFIEPGERRVHGDLFLGGASADLSSSGSGRVSISGERLSWLAGASVRRHHDLRAGRGLDSRNVFHRFFGMPPGEVRDLIGERQQDSGFGQYGFQTKLGARLRPDQSLTVYYQRGVQTGVRAYKDLLGGLGRVASTFEPQVLNWFYGRYEKLGLGFLDSLAGTFSLNSQSDGGERQNLRYSDPITRDFNRVDVYGYAVQASAHRGPGMVATFGGDAYDERIKSARSVLNPVTGAVTRPRPLYPDGSRYQNFGVYGQASYDVTSRVRASGGLRLTAVRFQTLADPEFSIPDSSQWFRDVTFHGTVRWQAAGPVGFHAVVSRGFRAPNLNDLGALGLNDLGYEIPSEDAIPAGALMSTDAGEGALSKGKRVGALSPESLMNYEIGARLSGRRFCARVQLFDAELYDPIVRRTLLFPTSAVPLELAGLPVTALPQTAGQLGQGVAAVATPLDSRGVKAFVNDGRSRYYGLESLVRYAIGDWTAEGNYSIIRGRELDPHRNVRRLPPSMGEVRLRYAMFGRRPWIEISMAWAGAQDRLSGGDLDDERIGASFRRRDIADFFQGARVAPYLKGGIFAPTGETLAQIQDRVLPVGASVNGVRVVDDNLRAPLYLSTAGWTTLSIRSGIPLGESWHAMAAVENLLDRNYRFHGSGIDAPGISAYVGINYRF